MKFRIRGLFAGLGMLCAAAAGWLKHTGELDWPRAVVIAGAWLVCMYVSLFPESPLGPKAQRPPGDK